MTEAKQLTAALGGHWYNTYGTASCPVCQPESRQEQNALTLSDGRRGLLLHCKKSGCRFTEILKSAGFSPRKNDAGVASTSSARTPDRVRQASHKSRIARQLWDAAQLISGTQAETYLRDRKITAELPSTLRYIPQIWHGPSRLNFPAMIARIDGGPVFSIHRTYLGNIGQGETVAPSSHPKMMLGASAGGHVTLAEGDGPLVISEGIETGLSLASGLVEPGATIWAALSAGNLRSVNLPSVPGHLVIASDGDPAGHSASAVLAARARHLGWSVDLKPAPDGLDWNDVLVSQAPDQDPDAQRDLCSRNPFQKPTARTTGDN